MYAESTAKKAKRTWTHIFCALAATKATTVPKQEQLLTLQQCGLGLKEITFACDDTAEVVQEKLIL